MINTYFKDKFPFAYNYFSTLLELVKNKQRQFPQALIFEGADTENQYLFALELARILNCKKDFLSLPNKVHKILYLFVHLLIFRQYLQ